MLQWLADLLNDAGFVPHGVCLLWRPGLLWTHVMSDGLIALAYFVIPLRLAALASARRDFAYRGTLWLFVAFIVLCGFTHVVGMVTIWEPIYGAQAVVKTLTAVVSVATAAWMVPLIPRLLEIPSPAELAARNAALAATIEERDALLVELRGHRERLEGAVASRTSELRAANASLARANADLGRSNHELEHFAYVASHDLQEPVRKILTFLDLARPRLRDDGHGRGLDYLARAEGAARRMHRLIHDLLTLSRVGRDDPVVEQVDLRAMIDGVVADHQEALRSADAVVVVDGELPLIETQPVLLRQVFTNLVDNAIKYRRSDVALRLEIVGSRLPDDGVRVVFTDNGRGFDAIDAAHLFRLFRRLGHDREVGGTGIGLALSRKIVEHLGGGIDARGEPDAGAVFSVTLPARAPARSAELAP